MLAWSLLPWGLIAGFYALLVCASILRGRAQRLEAGTSWCRLVAMALLLSLIPIVPIFVAWCMGTELDMSWTEPHAVLTQADVDVLPTGLPEGATFEPEHRVWLVPVESDTVMPVSSGLFEWLPRTNLVVVILACLLAVGLVGGLFMPMWRLARERVDYTPIEDPKVLARTGELANRIGAPRPRVLLRSTPDRSLHFSAMVGGALAPVMIISDGILQRMEDQETAGVLAHELAHLARGHPFRSVIPVIGVIALVPVLGAFLFPTVCVVLGLLLLRWSHRIFGRREELACDRLAGMAIGFIPAARALDKVHGAQTFDCSPTLGRIVHGMQEHPSRDLRLRHLASHATEAERASIVYDAHEAAAQQLTDLLVLSAFVCTVAFGVSAGLVESLKWHGIAAMLVLVVGAPMLPYCAVLPRLYYLWQLRPHRVPWRALLQCLLVVGLIGSMLAGLGQPYSWPTLAATAVAVILVWRRWKKRRTLVRIYRAVRDQDFHEALSCSLTLSKRIQRSPVHRLYRATLYAAMREDNRARQLLESLAADHPRFFHAQLLRATITGWDNPRAAVEISASIARALPSNPYAMAHHASHVSRASDPDAAEPLAREAIRILPAVGEFHGILAGILCKQGKLEQSEQQLQEYEARDPGATDLFLYRGHLLLARGKLEQARKMARRAREAIEANLISLLMHPLEELEAACARAEAAAAAAGR